jgi:hypothetical protein
MYINSRRVPLYEATAQVAIARVMSSVNLESAFQTNMNNVANTQDSFARRSSLLGLVQNGTVAQKVIDELGPELNGFTPATIMGLISAEFAGEPPSDLIHITAIADSPEKAASIANAWAKHYVDHINVLFGEMPAEMTDNLNAELANAEATYTTAQGSYETFLAENTIQSLTRQAQEKQQTIDVLQQNRQSALQGIISQTLANRQTIVNSYLQIVQENQLLALTSEQQMNRALVQSLLQAIGQNRQLAFSTEQQARVELFNQYAAAELQNRLLAMQREQDAKAQVFTAYSNADLQGKLTVFNQQVDSRVNALVGTYGTKQRIEQLLDESHALQTQIEQAGAAGAQSNALPLMLLKIEAYAATSTASELVQFDLTSSGNLESDIDDQAADIAALIDTLTARVAELDERIAEQSAALYNNEGYELLDGVRPEDDALYTAIQEQYLALFDVGELTQASNSVTNDNVLSQAILAKYDELFSLGNLANASLAISTTVPLYTALEAQYPSLFSFGDLTELGELLASNSQLDSASQQKLLELLQPVEDLESYFAAAETNAEPILQLENDVRALQASMESQRAQQALLIGERDLALATFNSVKSKLLELTLQRTAAGREVRLAAVANPPDRPIPGTRTILVVAACGVVGFMIAIAMVFLAAYQDAQPFFSRRHPAAVRPVRQATR